MPDTKSYTVSYRTPDQPHNIDSLCEDVLNKVQKINEDFVVVSSYVADYDKDGAKEEVRCVNGWCGWSWDLDQEIKDKKKCLYDSIIEEGFINDIGEKVVDKELVHGWVFG